MDAGGVGIWLVDLYWQALVCCELVNFPRRISVGFPVSFLRERRFGDGEFGCRLPPLDRQLVRT
jgi:hypothetical protein